MIKISKPFLLTLLLLILASDIACSPNQLVSTVMPTSEGFSIQGVVVDTDNRSVSGAVVRVKTTQLLAITNMDGKFKINGIDSAQAVKVTAWAPGYYISGGEQVSPGSDAVKIILHPYHTQDNEDYAWLPSTRAAGVGENQGCAECHSSAGTSISTKLPVDEWLLDAHSQSAVNPRFLSMYIGTDLLGNRSPLTQYGYSRDYGSFPLRPDSSKPYYGPGYKLDFPESAGNCAACHTPLAAVNDAYGIDPTQLKGVNLEGISCDFCHKVSGVKLDSSTGLPNANMPGVLSFDFLRPPAGHQFFAGPFDDVAPGEDTYTPIQQQSQFCAPCHTGVFWDTTIYNSFGEWLESSYSDSKTGKTCQTCHMPNSGATIVALPEKGGETRAAETIFSHLMPGAMDENLLQNAVTMNVQANQQGGKLLVSIKIVNDKTGHHVPTDSPLRQMILLVKALDTDGNALKFLNGPTVPEWGGVGDPTKGYYAGLPGKGFAKILMEMWTGVSPTGAYWNPTKIISDNRLAAFASDDSSYEFEMPTSGQVKIEVVLVFRRAFKQLMDQKSWQAADIIMQQTLISLPAGK